MAINEDNPDLARQSAERANSKEQGRREFLKTSAIFSAAAAIGPVLGMASAHAQANKDMKLTRGKTMKQRKLGTLQVSEIGAGCMNMSGNYNAPVSKDQGIKTIRKAFENGVTFFDTAEVYGPYIEVAPFVWTVIYRR